MVKTVEATPVQATRGGLGKAMTIESYTPQKLAEALEMLAAEDLTPYAGGTDLMVKERHPKPLLFLHRLRELRELVDDGENLRIGAALTFSELLAHPMTPSILKDAIASIAAPGIRNAGTLGGNIANASPKGDAALICFVADAKLRLASKRGERILPISDFYSGRSQTARAADELLVEILLPKRYLSNYCFNKVGARKALAISRVSFAGLYRESNAVIEHLALAFGAVEDVVVRRPQLDAMLIGKTVEEARRLKQDYIQAYAQAINPIQGRVSASYRKQVCLNLAEDFINSRLQDI